MPTTGCLGRTGVYELMALDNTIRHLICQQAGARDLQHAAQKNGMRTLRTNSIQKALAGITTVEEVLRITSSI